MGPIQIKNRIYKVNDFLSWQMDGSLVLNPPFQRRPVWTPQQKSYFMDTILRGFPIPVVVLRDTLNLDRLRSIKEVVDGQQRLRTLFTFIDSDCLRDFDSETESFNIKRIHNQEFASKTFSKLPAKIRTRILEYEISTHVLPPDVDDRQVLEVFARLNSSGTPLNKQELRGATYFGSLKTTMYSLAYENLDHWRTWKVLRSEEIARMEDVELVGDIFFTMLNGIQHITDKKRDDLYKQYDSEFENRDQLKHNFQQVIDQISDLYGEKMPDSVFHRPPMFLTLFAVFYHELFGLPGILKSSRRKKLPKRIASRLGTIDERFSSNDLPQEVAKSRRGGAGNRDSRMILFEFVQKQINE